jgi:hypothetical protein
MEISTQFFLIKLWLAEQNNNIGGYMSKITVEQKHVKKEKYEPMGSLEITENGELIINSSEMIAPEDTMFCRDFNQFLSLNRLFKHFYDLGLQRKDVEFVNIEIDGDKEEEE